MPKRKKRAPERSYARLTRHGRQTIERMPDRGKGAREMTREPGRSPSTTANEAGRHRFVISPRVHYGEPAPGEAEPAACPRLGSWPRCATAARSAGATAATGSRGSSTTPDGRSAPPTRDSEGPPRHRRGGPSAASKLEAIREGLGRGLSPEQVAAAMPGLGLSASTIYCCERNRAEIRKLPPKGRGIGLDRPTMGDAALVMSQANSEPRGKLAWRTPSGMLLAAFGDDTPGRCRTPSASSFLTRPSST